MKTAHKISLLSLSLAVLSTVVFALPQRTMLCIDGECGNPAYAQWTSLVIDTAFLFLFWLVFFYCLRMLVIIFNKNTSKRNQINTSLLILALFFTMATVYQKVELFNKTELNNLSRGWPMQYLSSGYSESRWDPPYPWTNSCMHFVGGLWGDPVDVQWLYFIFDIAISYLLLLVLFYGSHMVVRKIRKER